MAALASFIFVGPVAADNVKPLAEPPSFARSLDRLRAGGSHKFEVDNLETLARLGDARAQVIVGTIYLEGKHAPQDKVKGFAWLQVAATPRAATYFTQNVPEKAKALMHEAEPMLAPGERSEADRTAADFVAEFDRRIDQGIERAFQLFMSQKATAVANQAATPETSVVLAPPMVSSEEPLYRVGCAANRAASCPPESVLEGTHCTGLVHGPVLDPESVSVGGADARIVRPEYPMDARRKGLEGSVVILAHIDSSGWICGAALAVSSGIPSMDHAAADAVSQWKVRPGTIGGQAVEIVSPLRVDFHLKGFTIKN